MRSRMDRYNNYDENTKEVSRSDKNKGLYNNIDSNKKYTNFTDINRVNAIEIEEAKRNCKTREGYHQIKEYEDITPKPKVKKELDDFNYLYQDHENRVYDINSVLESAKKNRKDIDDEEAKRKLKNTNYNILASLNPEELEKYRKEKQNRNKPDEDTLRTLIDTITSKTLRGEIDTQTGVDLLSDLMATNINDKIDNDEDLELSKKILEEDIIGKEKELKSAVSDNLKDVDDSFYTRSMDLSDKDFSEDFDDVEKTSKWGIFFKVVLVILLLAIVGVIIYFLIKGF